MNIKQIFSKWQIDMDRKILLYMTRVPCPLSIASCWTLFDINFTSSHLYSVTIGRIKSHQASKIIKIRMQNSREYTNQSNFPKMKIMQFVQKKLAAIGISRPPAAQANPFNGKLQFDFSILTVALVCCLLYAAHEAKSVFEYMQAAYVISMLIAIMFLLLVLILKTRTLFELIEDFESLTHTSEYRDWNTIFRMLFLNVEKFVALKYTATRPIFNETIQFEEKVSEIMFFIIAYVSLVVATLPACLYSCFIYLTTDSGNDAFVLPLPLW